MNQYLTDTEYAANALFAAITYERDQLAELLKKRDEAQYLENASYGAMHARMRLPYAHHWQNEHQRAAKEKNEAEEKVAEMELRIADREFSIETLAGAVLQLAKQGISTVYGKPDNCPKAREVFGQPIARVIFAGRNQALHYEEPKRVDDNCTEVLAALAEGGADQRLKQAREGKNLAAVMLGVLDWKDYDAYLKDMTNLLD